MENLKTLLLNSGLIVVAIVGVIIIYGLLLGFQEDISRKNLFSSLGYFGIIITAPGVIIHELSHYIMCKIFRYRVTEVKLFRPIAGKVDGVLGYVRHSHNPRNSIQNAGMFFIGTAPILGGAVSLWLALRFLLPDTFTTLMSYVNQTPSFMSVGLKEFIISQISAIWYIIQLIFNSIDINNINFWIFLYLAISIASHIGLSGADLNGSIHGLISLFVMVFVVGFVLSIFGINMIDYLNKISVYNLLLSVMLNVALALALIHLIISYVIKFIFGFLR